jgi:N-acetylglucosamine-6-phosphate deacetylase
VNPALPTTLLQNCCAVLPDRISQSASVFVAGGRIAEIIEAPALQVKADTVIDLDGLTLFPGFIDVHIHGAAGVDTMEADVADLKTVSEFLARHGVTAWLPTLVPASSAHYNRAVNAISETIETQASTSNTQTTRENLAARVVGVHYEGPFVNSEQCGALHRGHFRTFTDVSDVDFLPTVKQSGAAHMMTLAPEIDGGIALIYELNRRGWITSIGHTLAPIDVLDRALKAGARHMTHFMNAMPPLHHRAPGPVGWGLINDDVSCDIIADGVHIDPMIIKLIWRHKTADRISLISDAIAPTGLGDGEYQLWDETIAVKDGRTQNAHSSIAGSVTTMLDAVRMMLSLDVSEAEVACMASLNPARLLGIDRECGSIEAGKRADLVAINQQGNVELVMIDGVCNERTSS